MYELIEENMHTVLKRNRNAFKATENEKGGKKKRKANRTALKRGDKGDEGVIIIENAERKICGKDEDAKWITEYKSGAQVIFDVDLNKYGGEQIPQKDEDEDKQRSVMVNVNESKQSGQKRGRKGGGINIPTGTGAKMEPVSIISIKHTCALDEKESDTNCMKQGERTRETQGGEVHELVRTGDEPPPERGIETCGNPLAISSGVKLYGESPTDRASKEPISHTKERGETIGDQCYARTIAQQIENVNIKKAPQVEADVATKTVRRVPTEGEGIVADGHRKKVVMELRKGPVAEVGCNRSSSQSGERPKSVDSKTQTVAKRTPKMEQDEVALRHATEPEVNVQGNVRPTTDEDGPVHASPMAQEGTVSCKPQPTSTPRPTERSAFMAPQRSVAQFLQCYRRGVRHSKNVREGRTEEERK